jgi:hypothetical protein
MRALTLIIPDLISTLAQADEAGQILPLLKQLSQSSSIPCEPYEDEATAFYRWLGEKGTLPRAELLAHHYKLPPAAAWILAEPIECQSTSENIYCLGAAHLQLDQFEANQWIESLNQHLTQVGMRLYAPEPTRWLLALPSEMPFKTQSLSTVVNRALPSTSLLFAELQMLMHQHPLNHSRQLAGKPVIHACWLSGEGKLPMLNKRPTVGVVTEDPITQVLAQWIDAQPCQSLNTLESTVQAHAKDFSEMVICLKATHHAIALEQNDMKALLEQRWGKQLEQIRVYGGDNLCYDAPRQWVKKKLPFL